MIRSIFLAGPLALVAAMALSACDSATTDTAQETAASGVTSEPPTTPQPPQLPGQIVRAFAGTQLPPMTFVDPKGNELDFAALDQPVLVNLWATWCAPCVVEMPLLDNLAAELEGEVRVLTISQDVRGAEVVVPFFEQRNFQHLEQWLDPVAGLSAEFADSGLLPMTILFDANGRELFRVAGDYEWDSEDAAARVRDAVAESQSAS